MARFAPPSSRSLFLLLLLPALLTLRIAAQRTGGAEPALDWPQFGYNAASPSASPAGTGIGASNIASLSRRQVNLGGTADASVIYLHGANIAGSLHDAFFVTTSYGKTIAIDADSGAAMWQFTPAAYSSLVGTAQVTNSTPAADPDRQFLYAAAPDGTVQKLAVADGHVVWSTSITLLPSKEKIASPIKIANGRVIAVTGGYDGDAPPYQGHVAILDAQSGSLLSVWNSLCSSQSGLIAPASCPSTRSAIWGRAGALVDPTTGNLFVATGNGPYDGKTNWGDALMELDPGAGQVLGNYTPADNAALNSGDLDLGSTSPVFIAPGILAQGGKDRLIRLIPASAISGAAAHAGGELQNVPTPSKNMLFTALAVWQNQQQTWLFAADGGATAAWSYGNGALTAVWNLTTGGTSPVVAGGLLYVYNPSGGLHVYNPTSGTQIANLTCGSGHWNSPIVADGRIALPEGSANSHAATGILDIWSAPARRVPIHKAAR
jgi:outer membrane protein assembly factor BamB